MPIKVSVVVPVRNPGRHIDRCVRSLREQRLGDAEWEAIFVDDGSDDGTQDLLERLAAQDDHLRLVRLPQAGAGEDPAAPRPDWPGAARNAGIEAARGEYVQLLDATDTLGPGALPALYELARRGDADVVLGKMASDYRGVPHAVFAATRERCSLSDAPLVDSLTPHKLFRTRFLLEHGLRFDENRRYLRDQLFMMRCYFAARSVAILGHRICYISPRTRAHPSARPQVTDTASYAAALRDVFDLLESGSEPGEFRDSLIRRFYRVEMLGFLDDETLVHGGPGAGTELFARLHQLSLDRISKEVHEGLPALLRARSALLRADRYDGLVELARRCEQITARTWLEEAGWRKGRLHLRLRAELAYERSGPALGLVRRGGSYFCEDALVDGLVETAEAEVTRELAGLRVEVGARDRDTGGEWPVPADLEMRLDEGERDETGVRCAMSFTGTATLDPQRLAGRGPLPRGTWDLWVRLNMLGVNRRTRLGARRAPEVDDRLPPAILGKPAQVIVPYYTRPHSNLSLDVDRRSKSLGDALTGRPVRPEPGNGQRIELGLDAISSPGTASAPVALLLYSRGAKGVAGQPGAAVLPARLETAGWTARLVADVGRGPFGPVARLAAGRWRLTARLDPAGPETGAGSELILGTAEVDQRGRLFVDGAPLVGPASELTRRLTRAAIARPRVRRLGVRVVDRLPDPWRLWVRDVVRLARR